LHSLSGRGLQALSGPLLLLLVHNLPSLVFGIILTTRTTLLACMRSQIMANGLLEWFPPNRLASTFPEFHNLKGIPQEKSYLFVHQWFQFGTALFIDKES